VVVATTFDGILRHLPMAFLRWCSIKVVVGYSYVVYSYLPYSNYCWLPTVQWSYVEHQLRRLKAVELDCIGIGVHGRLWLRACIWV